MSADYKVTPLFSLIILATLGCSRDPGKASPHAGEEGQKAGDNASKTVTIPRDPPIQEPALMNGVTDIVVVLNATAASNPTTTVCPKASAIFAGIDVDPDFLESYVGQLPRDLTACQWGTVRKNLDEAKKENLIGMIFGFAEEASVTLGDTEGTEFLAVKDPNSDDMLFGVYAYRGYDFGLGLPGVSAVQGYVVGDCGKKPLAKYAGWFRTLSAAALSYSYGKGDWRNWQDTGCNAWTVTRGMTTPVLGFSRTYYMQKGRFIRVRGDYFAPTVRVFSKAR